jgi:hypothetical protein
LNLKTLQHTRFDSSLRPEISKSFSQIVVWSLPDFSAVKSFPTQGNSYRGPNPGFVYFEGLENGIRHALSHGRRSGAQRGAPENNFGQRFSWAPLAISSNHSKAPPPNEPLFRECQPSDLSTDKYFRSVLPEAFR